MQYKYIFFDWGGVLGFKKHEFINSDSYRYDLLYPNLHDILDYLINKGYKLGIISNTSMSREPFIKALKKHNLYYYFDIIVLSSDKGMCRKNCKKIFLKALDNLNPTECLFVGNSIEKDIIGANKVGLNTALVIDIIEEDINILIKKYKYIKINYLLFSGIKDLLYIL
jgi:HAD superfamily hydrolase (TIGR01549 family)